MRDWIIPSFEELHQDVQFFVRANALRRFLLTQKTAKAGWVLNVRDTTALDNMIAQPYKLVGKPTGKDIDPRFPDSKSNFVGMSLMRWDAYTPRASGWFGKGEIELKRDVIYVGTLFSYNISYHHNAKTVAFVNELKNRDRFTQHCIINNLEWNRETYDEWVYKIEQDRDWDAQMREMERGCRDTYSYED